MNMRVNIGQNIFTYLLLSVYFACAFCLVYPASSSGQSTGEVFDPPNIVLIIADDMAWDDCGVCGHPNIRTPNIDKLAEDGMMFHQAFLQTSSCSPSRASIITGTYPNQTNAEQLHWAVPSEMITFVEKLKEAGYWTAQAGKWHMGSYIQDRFDFLASANMQELQRTYGELPENDGSGSHLWVPLIEHRPKDKPFFLWLAALDPHRQAGYTEGTIDNPHSGEDAIIPSYIPDTEVIRMDFAMYYDEIGRLDSYLGMVVEVLKRQGVNDNTVILFISDNGRPFPRDKTTLYDSGIKTPWIIKWPDKVTPGTQTQSLVSAVDIAPTVLSLAGVDVGHTFVGIDFSPILFNPDSKIRDYIFAQAHWHDVEDFIRAIRDERYKYIRNFFNEMPGTPPADVLNSPTFKEMLRLKVEEKLDEHQLVTFIQPRPAEELYDLKNDPYEINNLAEDMGYQTVLNKMRGRLIENMENYEDKVPVFRTPDEFHRTTGKSLPNNQGLNRVSHIERFNECNCIYISPSELFPWIN